MWHSSGSIICVTGQTYGKDQYSINIEAYTEVTRCLEGFSNFKLFELLSFFLFASLCIHIFLLFPQQKFKRLYLDYIQIFQTVLADA